MKEEIFSPKYFDECMRDYAENVWRLRNTEDVVDDLIVHLRQALQHKKLVGKRNSFTVFI